MRLVLSFMLISLIMVYDISGQSIRSHLIHVGRSGTFDNKGHLSVNCSMTGSKYYKQDFFLSEIKIHQFFFKLQITNISDSPLKVSISGGHVFAKHAPDLINHSSMYTLQGDRSFELASGDSRIFQFNITDDWYPMSMEEYEAPFEKDPNPWIPYWVKINIGYAPIPTKNKPDDLLADLEDQLMDEMEEIDEEVKSNSPTVKPESSSAPGAKNTPQPTGSAKSNSIIPEKSTKTYDQQLCNGITKRYTRILSQLKEQSNRLINHANDLNYSMDPNRVLHREMETLLQEINELSSKDQLSPECMEEIQQIAEKFANDYIDGMEEYIEKVDNQQPHAAKPSPFESLQAPSQVAPQTKSTTPSMNPTEFAPANFKTPSEGIMPQKD